jgi:hypothetical protein
MPSLLPLLPALEKTCFTLLSFFFFKVYVDSPKWERERMLENEKY